MKELKFSFIYVVYLLILLRIQRKINISSEAMDFLREHSEDGMDFRKSWELRVALEKNRNPAVLLLNKVRIDFWDLSFITSTMIYNFKFLHI